MTEESQTLVYKKDTAHIYFHLDHKVLHLKCHCEDCRKTYPEVITALKRLTLELGVEGWLFDLSPCKLVQAESTGKDLEGLAYALSESNLKKYARVASQDISYEGAIMKRTKLLNELFNLGLEVGNFETETEALAWLFDASEGTLVAES